MNERERPERFSKERSDCTVRALTTVSGLPYDQVHEAFRIAGRKDRRGVKAKKVIQKVCRILNLKAIQVQRSGSVRKLIKRYPVGSLFCTMRGHAFPVIDGIIKDWVSPFVHLRGAWLISK